MNKEDHHKFPKNLCPNLFLCGNMKEQVENKEWSMMMNPK